MAATQSRIDFNQVADTPTRTVLKQLYDYINKVLQSAPNPVVWQDVAGVVGFQNGWVNFGPSQLNAAFAFISPGMVALRGEISSGAAAIIFTLPAGFRPPGNARFAIASNTAYGEIVVKADGTVNFVVGSNLAVSLDGIFFSINP